MIRALLFFGLLAMLPMSSTAASAAIGGPFRLTDQDGRVVTQASFAGKPLLLYFGYTSCPDVCPVDLARIVRIAASLREKTGATVTPVFVTVDPERDTAERLKAYVAAFGQNVVGLTGTRAQIDAIAQEYHVYSKRVPVEGGAYLMDHSTMLFLIGADGLYLDHYGRKAAEQDIVDRAVAKLKAAA
jgi:cytochrome oxidase Cu insertion factor (SCO1/SenC/PrrC family)